MTSVAIARTGRSVAVTALGLVTLLTGGYFAVLGGWAIFAGDEWLMHPSKDPWIQLIALGGIVPVLLIVLGIVFLLLGILGLLAGAGVLLRRPWGRILTFIVAVGAILMGLLVVSGSDQGSRDIALGAGQILYGILAFVILITKGEEFIRRRL